MKNYTIKEISKTERPMEKLYFYGKDSLSNSELLAILIGSGIKNKNAITLSEEILKFQFTGSKLLFCSVNQLMKIEGIGLSKACRILAGLELGKRLSKLDKIKSISFTNPDSVAEYLFEHFRDSYREEFIILLLNTKNNVISAKTIFTGTLNQALIHPREIFREAVLSGASSIILSHNHPSGDPTPSEEDISITLKLIEAGRNIGIKVLDHLIIGHLKYISLKEKGIIKE